MDSKDQQATSGNVEVTLGRDEEKPVINLVSPPVTATEGGEDLAEVVEEGNVVLKISGYDNVQVNRLILKGIRRDGPGYLLTGDLNDVLQGDDFAPQQIPGALHAYSSLKLIKVPSFTHTGNVTHDRYPIEATAIDKTGNQSTVALIVAVMGDKIPYIVEARREQEQYFPRDDIVLNVQARDDRAVSGLSVRYFLDGESNYFHQQQIDSNSGLTPGENVQHKFTLALKDFQLSNAAHQIKAVIEAVDNRGQHSSDDGVVFELMLPVVPDITPPQFGILKPVQGSTLYHGTKVTAQWRAFDDSQLDRVRLTANGTVIRDDTFVSQGASNSLQTRDGSFVLNVPESGDELLIEAEVFDVYGGKGVSEWRYKLTSDVPPEITIRTPAAGSRLVEGEPFTMAARVVDNRQISKVTFFVENGATSLYSKTFTDPEELNQVQNDGKYLAVAMRTPYRPEESEGEIKIGVRAWDNEGLMSEELLDITILDDSESPLIVMDNPDGPISILPGQSFKVLGKGEDNFYIQSVQPVLVDDEGVETILSWESFARDDRVESIRVPNPLTFGSMIAAQRFYLDFTARLKLPESYVDQTGKTFTFKLRTKDRGINVTDTPGIALTVKGDEEAPEISINKPEEEVVERQIVETNIEISDNVALSGYKIYLDGNADTPILEQQDVGSETVSISSSDLLIDLQQFAPIPEQGKNFSIVVEAEDTSGNRNTATRLVKIFPDSPPSFNVLDPSPENNPLRRRLFR